MRNSKKKQAVSENRVGQWRARTVAAAVRRHMPQEQSRLLARHPNTDLLQTTLAEHATDSLQSIQLDELAGHLANHRNNERHVDPRSHAASMFLRRRSAVRLLRLQKRLEHMPSFWSRVTQCRRDELHELCAQVGVAMIARAFVGESPDTVVVSLAVLEVSQAHEVADSMDHLKTDTVARVLIDRWRARYFDLAAQIEPAEIPFRMGFLLLCNAYYFLGTMDRCAVRGLSDGAFAAEMDLERIDDLCPGEYEEPCVRFLSSKILPTGELHDE